MRTGETDKRRGGFFSHRRFVMEQLDDVLMRPLRQRLRHIEPAGRPQQPPSLGERAFELGAGHMVERKHKDDEVGAVIRLGDRIRRGLGKPITAGRRPG